MVPTFDIAKLALVGTPQNRNIGASVAGAASLANPITSAITPVSGANALTGFRLPRGFRGVFVVIPAGACTGATGGTLAYDDTNDTEDIPFAKAWAAVANKAMLFVSDGALIYPFVLTAAG